MSDTCIILMSNKPYLEKAKRTIRQIREIGKYKDDIVLLIGNDLKNDNLIIDNVIIKYFPDIDRSAIIDILKNKSVSFDGREFNKPFQWHKVHVFDMYFKKWKKCLYIDAGMYIFNPINKIINLNCENKIVAHSDAYPTFEWKLRIQFNETQFPVLYNELCTNYNLDIDYFQSGILLYDTNIIEENTKNDLLELSNKYINSRTNDQGIMNIYFICIKKIWQPIDIKDEETYYYDYWERGNLKYYDYIMLKYPKTIYYK